LTSLHKILNYTPERKAFEEDASYLSPKYANPKFSELPLHGISPALMKAKLDLLLPT